jgi:hypothetical protein
MSAKMRGSLLYAPVVPELLKGDELVILSGFF